MPNILCSSVNATTGASEVNASNCDTLLAATHFKVDNAKRYVHTKPGTRKLAIPNTHQVRTRAHTDARAWGPLVAFFDGRATDNSCCYVQ